MRLSTKHVVLLMLSFALDAHYGRNDNRKLLYSDPFDRDLLDDDQIMVVWSTSSLFGSSNLSYKERQVYDLICKKKKFVIMLNE